MLVFVHAKGVPTRGSDFLTMLRGLVVERGPLEGPGLDEFAAALSDRVAGRELVSACELAGCRVLAVVRAGLGQGYSQIHSQIHAQTGPPALFPVLLHVSKTLYRQKVLWLLWASLSGFWIQ